MAPDPPRLDVLIDLGLEDHRKDKKTDRIALFGWHTIRRISGSPALNSFYYLLVLVPLIYELTLALQNGATFRASDGDFSATLTISANWPYSTDFHLAGLFGVLSLMLGHLTFVLRAPDILLSYGHFAQFHTYIAQTRGQTGATRARVYWRIAVAMYPTSRKAVMFLFGMGILLLTVYSFRALIAFAI